MNERICRVCSLIFVTKSPYVLVCSDDCRELSNKKSRNKYKKSEKGLIAKDQWNKNPKKKECLKRHMSGKGKQTASKRMSRLVKTNEYYRQTKNLRQQKAYRELRTQLISQFKKCAACEIDHDLTIDHVHPLSKGGKHEIENIQVLCRSCNSKKKQETILYAVPKV